MWNRKSKWNLIIFAVVVLLLISSIFFLWMRTNIEVRSVVEEQYQNQQLLLTRHVAGGIQQTLNERVSLLEVIAKKDSGVPDDNFESDLKSVYEIARLFYVVEYVAENGTIVSGYPEESVPLGFNLYENDQSRAFEYVKTNNEVYITDPLKLMEGNYGAFIWIPVYEGDEFRGAFIAIIKESDLKDRYVVESNSSSYAYLIDDRGRILYEGDHNYKRGALYVDIFGSNASGLQEIVADQVNGSEGNGKYLLLENGTIYEERLVSYSPIEWYNQKWSLALTSPSSEVDRLIVSVYLKLFIVAMVSVLFIIFVSSFLVIILYNWSKSLEKEVGEKTQELKESNESLRAANKKLKELDRLKTEFLSIVSHELKTPLTAMRTSSEFLRESDECSIPVRRQMLDIIIRNIDRQSRMVDDLLDISRIESNRMKFHKESLDIEETVNTSLEMLSAVIKEKSMNILVEIPDDLPQVYTDRDKLVQVFVNLLNNAAKFSKKNGNIRITAQDDSDLVRISVSDDGIGMSPEELEKIFDKFYQIDSTSTRKVGGSGLGLSIVKGIIEGQGGSIVATSEQGKGSTFIFTLTKA
ncbi:His Kinase A (phospho-acceptor) domain-containing protein [Methanolobus vulcani]|uniref:histidine kinase n=1 Tax=Methanolobus vulcani TaxID=38026 RepID=A0A7Z7AVW6_9EURY|nr:sensor histidine kinase [Methanolobus vulcani]SDF68894.1 His Kinase A (phospho-acceptor) domain-containing protein [Methanolobus vulcani]